MPIVIRDTKTQVREGGAYKLRFGGIIRVFKVLKRGDGMFQLQYHFESEDRIRDHTWTPDGRYHGAMGDHDYDIVDEYIIKADFARVDGISSMFSFMEQREKELRA